MVTILFAIISICAFHFRSRAALELKLVALEHQLAVLRRQRAGRPSLSSLNRLLWVLLDRSWPKVDSLRPDVRHEGGKDDST